MHALVVMLLLRRYDARLRKITGPPREQTLPGTSQKMQVSRLRLLSKWAVGSLAHFVRMFFQVVVQHGLPFELRNSELQLTPAMIRKH